ncbi:MAG: universal stress protein [Verrucomicrobiota bacterium]
MYHHILIPLENDWADASILIHVRKLAKLTGARLLLIHVADGWAARNFDVLGLQESDEMRKDRAYLERRVQELSLEGFDCDAVLALGEPADEIVKLAIERGVDLIAMATHGHKLIGDLIFGNTADKVRHRVKIPVLMLMAEKAVSK